MMVRFTKAELRKLSAVCISRLFYCEEIIKDPDSSGLEKACAQHELEYMEHLSAKLSEVADSTAKRVEIK